MGARGPIPNREADLNRPRSRKGSDQQETIKGIAYEATVPEMDEDWHPIAKMLWQAMLESGQSDFYQSTDWAIAYSLCEDLTRYKEPQVNSKTGELYHKRSGQMLQTIYSAMGDLLLTEGQRRRIRMELAAPEDDETPASVTAIASYKQGLGLDE